MKTNLQSIKLRYGIIGNSPALDHALTTAVRVANTDLSVLISGESGVGKEVFSKIIHSLSARKHNPFIAINCGAIPEGTINSELFGHEKGAFTGASSDRKGYFETVNGGTIFLDEIGEMPLDTQTYLLRVLETGDFFKVGSSKALSTDVRVIAATNVDLLEKVRKGKFREDLYYRLNIVPIHVPALKDRPEDIHLLFRKFAVDYAEKYRTTPIRLDEKARLLIENYRWPGNIRELRNITEQISVLSEEKLITAEDLINFIPTIRQRHLPALSPQNGEEGELKEREILYKLLFEMKHDLNELKSLVFQMINDNNLTITNLNQLHQLKAPGYSEQEYKKTMDNFRPSIAPYHSGRDDIRSSPEELPLNKPIIIENADQHRYENTEIVEENLSLVEMEKEAIRKALKKHKGRRKDAAKELKISERTLYRKIRLYKL